MEEAYKLYREAKELPPWSSDTVRNLCEKMEKRLAVRGKYPRNSMLRSISYSRAETAITELGRFLFPLIVDAEVRLQATRAMPLLSGVKARSKYYEICGVVDVLTSISVSEAWESNKLLRTIRTKHNLQVPDTEFEIIVDYKGMRRPSFKNEFWEHLHWQINTYAWLRGMQPKSKPVYGGILIFINELMPSKEDLKELRKEILQKLTDVPPPEESEDYESILAWDTLKDPPEISSDFRFKRAILYVEINSGTIANSINRFADVVKDIEENVQRETRTGRIVPSWPNYPSENSCTVCDFENFCPGRSKEGKVRAPSAP